MKPELDISGVPMTKAEEEFSKDIELLCKKYEGKLSIMIILKPNETQAISFMGTMCFKCAAEQLSVHLITTGAKHNRELHDEEPS